MLPSLKAASRRGAGRFDDRICEHPAALELHEELADLRAPAREAKRLPKGDVGLGQAAVSGKQPA